MSEIKPALSKEEWELPNPSADRAGMRVEQWTGTDLVLSGAWDEKVIIDEIRHATAALCLYGQPFGFTREDVDLLRETVSALWETGSTRDDAQERDRQDKAYASLADRIEALLPS